MVISLTDRQILVCLYPFKNTVHFTDEPKDSLSPFPDFFNDNLDSFLETIFLYQGRHSLFYHNKRGGPSTILSYPNQSLEAPLSMPKLSHYYMKTEDLLVFTFPPLTLNSPSPISNVQHGKAPRGGCIHKTVANAKCPDGGDLGNVVRWQTKPKTSITKPGILERETRMSN